VTSARFREEGTLRIGKEDWGAYFKDTVHRLVRGLGRAGGRLWLEEGIVEMMTGLNVCVTNVWIVFSRGHDEI